MTNWKELKIHGIASIEKCVAEFKVGELIKTPHAAFKVKICERSDGNFVGFTNLQLKDQDGCPFAGVGYGATIEEALEDTIRYFLLMIDEKGKVDEDDFVCADPYDF